MTIQSDDVTIGGIWLRRTGGENDPNAKAQVDVQVNGHWFTVIEEPISANFSHCVTASSIKTEASEVL